MHMVFHGAVRKLEESFVRWMGSSSRLSENVPAGRMYIVSIHTIMAGSMLCKVSLGIDARKIRWATV